MDTTSANKDTVVQINMTGGSGKTNCPPLVPAIIIITTNAIKIIISNITERTRMTRVPPSLKKGFLNADSSRRHTISPYI